MSGSSLYSLKSLYNRVLVSGERLVVVLAVLEPLHLGAEQVQPGILLLHLPHAGRVPRVRTWASNNSPRVLIFHPVAHLDTALVVGLFQGVGQDRQGRPVAGENGGSQGHAGGHALGTGL